MNQQERSHHIPPLSWTWPINLATYNRTPALTAAERTELTRKLERPHFQIKKETRAALQRLLQPIDDVCEYAHIDHEVHNGIVRCMLMEMHRRQTAFWGWSMEEWRESVGPTRAAFALRYGRSRAQNVRARTYLPLLAYLLDVLPNPGPLIELIEMPPLAERVFGKEVIDSAVERLITILRGWGYQQQERHPFVACVAYLLLCNKSPHLEDLSIDLIEAVGQACRLRGVQKHLAQISRALFALGLLPRHLPDLRRERAVVESGIDGSVSEEWLAWCQRWRNQSVRGTRRSVYYQLLKVGRWLKATHPEVKSPGDFTHELVAEFVAVVNEMKVGEWIDTHKKRVPTHRVEQPMKANAKMQLLNALRVFLRDCQASGWIPIRLNPYRDIPTPRSILNQIGPDPRVVDTDRWAKILWAAMNLEEKDLPLSGSDASFYPLELVRAIAVVWCFAALRCDEVVRLRVGCIRWQREDAMIPETGEILPKDAVCFLDIPVNKTSTAYTKPVHSLVGKRINEWEAVRPREQPRALDKKTNEAVYFLFSYRSRRIAKTYLTSHLIPLLCHKAGIPIEDSRGKITSHRARATIASMLYNAQEPLDIFQLKEYLGHKHLSSTQQYLRINPTKLAKEVVKAGYLEQNLATIEVLLDQEAVLSGAASRGECWKYYDLGHGWCTNPFWSACVHRMACARCPYYRPKDSLKEQFIEGKANLVRMLEFVQLTEDEKLLVTEGVELHQELIEKLADVPTPAGPTPRELNASHEQERKVIPLKSVQRSRKRRSDDEVGR
jgi:integrase